jgi:predicted protein tyrosine phosphatase
MRPAGTTLQSQMKSNSAGNASSGHQTEIYRYQSCIFILWRHWLTRLQRDLFKSFPAKKILMITITDLYSDDTADILNVIEKTFSIANNPAGIYEDGGYRV